MNRLTLASAQTGKPGYRLEMSRQTEPAYGDQPAVEYVMVRLMDNKTNKVRAVFPSVGLGVLARLAETPSGRGGA